MQQLLRKTDHHLVVVLDEQKVATDVFVRKNL